MVVMRHRQNKPPAVPCELLVSLMGFSPETTVLATTLVQPRQLVVIASKSAGGYCDQCLEFLTEHSLMAREMISVRMVDPTDHDALLRDSLRCPGQRERASPRRSHGRKEDHECRRGLRCMECWPAGLLSRKPCLQRTDAKTRTGTRGARCPRTTDARSPLKMSRAPSSLETQPLAVELARERLRKQVVADLLVAMNTDPRAVSHHVGGELCLMFLPRALESLTRDVREEISTEELLEPVRDDLTRACHIVLERDQKGEGLVLRINSENWYLIVKPGRPAWVVVAIHPRTVRVPSCVYRIGLAANRAKRRNDGRHAFAAVAPRASSTARSRPETRPM